jgi:hypothetical protein
MKKKPFDDSFLIKLTKGDRKRLQKLADEHTEGNLSKLLRDSALARSKDDFTRGYACAAGVVAYLDGTTSNAREIIKQGGFDYNFLVKADVDEGDLARIYPDRKKKRRS